MMKDDGHGSELAGVLQRVLALPADDQKRLRDILASLGGAPSGAQPPAESDTTYDTGGGEGAEAHVAQWLDQVRREDPWSQLRLLDDAIERAEDEEQARSLREARSRLLQENPPIAVRSAIVRLATERPMAVGAGSVGLILALFALGRGLFHLLF